MGKAARFACIFTPMALTIASFVCLALIEIAGWNKGTLTDMYFFRANLTNLDATAGSNEALTTALGTVKSGLADEYQIYLWNYCQDDDSSTNNTLDKCSDRKGNFVFDPLSVWGLEISNSTNATSTSSADNAVESAINNVKDNISEYEDQLLGNSGRKALETYRKVAKWMFIAYQVSFWTTLATIIIGILALFSRWGSLITWILALASSVFTIAAVLTSTILFSVLVTALNKALEDYNIKLTLGHQALTTAWLGVAFSWAATLFWMFSVCCCSGKSNPHHRSNKGGLWNAEPKGQGYGRGLTAEKTGGSGYQRVSSPYVGGPHEDQVPLQDYAQPTGYNNHQGAGFEPYRHA